MAHILKLFILYTIYVILIYRRQIRARLFIPIVVSQLTGNLILFFTIRMRKIERKIKYEQIFH